MRRLRLAFERQGSPTAGLKSLAALEAAGVLKIAGNRALAERFVTLFPLPPKVA